MYPVEDADESDSVNPDDLITCWCGASGTYDELFDDSCLDDCCGGSGELHCECGGDFCVCHHHGSTECPGCPDCESEDDYDWDEDDWNYYDGQEER